jgi:hypothetical protein
MSKLDMFLLGVVVGAGITMTFLVLVGVYG